MVKVSVVIPNYNGKKYLKGCIDSVLTQEEVTFEIIIIDNASTDEQYEWINSYKEIQFYRLDKNYGFSRAVNEGIRRAKGQYILLLNNDTVLEKAFLKEMVYEIEKDSQIFGVSSKMISYHNHAIMDDAGDEYTVLGWAYKRGDGKGVEAYEKGRKVFSACAGAALYRKTILDKIGLFDENFFAYMEDVDISYRARIYGYYNVYAPKAKVYHIGSATSGSKYNDFKVRLAARNNLFVPYKNMPLLQLIINIPALIVGLIIKYIWFSRKGYKKAYTEGLVKGMKELKSIQKVPFKLKHIKNYLHIEILLIKNIITYIFYKLRKK